MHTHSVSAKLAMAFALPAMVALGGCNEAHPIKTVSTNNTEVNYNVLFNRLGCEVGRFDDGGKTVYLSLCPKAGVSDTTWEERCGKGCVRDVQQAQRTIRPE